MEPTDVTDQNNNQDVDANNVEQGVTQQPPIPPSVSTPTSTTSSSASSNSFYTSAFPNTGTWTSTISPSYEYLTDKTSQIFGFIGRSLLSKTLKGILNKYLIDVDIANLSVLGSEQYGYGIHLKNVQLREGAHLFEFDSAKSSSKVKTKIQIGQGGVIGDLEIKLLPTVNANGKKKNELFIQIKDAHLVLDIILLENELVINDNNDNEKKEEKVDKETNKSTDKSQNHDEKKSQSGNDKNVSKIDDKKETKTPPSIGSIISSLPGIVLSNCKVKLVMIEKKNVSKKDHQNDENEEKSAEEVQLNSSSEKETKDNKVVSTAKRKTSNLEEEKKDNDYFISSKHIIELVIGDFSISDDEEFRNFTKDQANRYQQKKNKSTDSSQSQHNNHNNIDAEATSTTGLTEGGSKNYKKDSFVSASVDDYVWKRIHIGSTQQHDNGGTSSSSLGGIWIYAIQKFFLYPPSLKGDNNSKRNNTNSSSMMKRFSSSTSSKSKNSSSKKTTTTAGDPNNLHNTWAYSLWNDASNTNNYIKRQKQRRGMLETNNQSTIDMYATTEKQQVQPPLFHISGLDFCARIRKEEDNNNESSLSNSGVNNDNSSLLSNGGKSNNSMSAATNGTSSDNTHQPLFTNEYDQYTIDSVLAGYGESYVSIYDDEDIGVNDSNFGRSSTIENKDNKQSNENDANNITIDSNTGTSSPSDANSSLQEKNPVVIYLHIHDLMEMNIEKSNLVTVSAILRLLSLYKDSTDKKSATSTPTLSESNIVQDQKNDSNLLSNKGKHTSNHEQNKKGNSIEANNLVTDNSSSVSQQEITNNNEDNNSSSEELVISHRNNLVFSSEISCIILRIENMKSSSSLTSQNQEQRPNNNTAHEPFHVDDKYGFSFYEICIESLKIDMNDRRRITTTTPPSSSPKHEEEEKGATLDYRIAVQEAQVKFYQGVCKPEERLLITSSARNVNSSSHDEKKETIETQRLSSSSNYDELQNSLDILNMAQNKNCFQSCFLDENPGIFVRYIFSLVTTTTNSHSVDDVQRVVASLSTSTSKSSKKLKVNVHDINIELYQLFLDFKQLKNEIVAVLQENNPKSQEQAQVSEATSAAKSNTAPSPPPASSPLSSLFINSYDITLEGGTISLKPVNLSFQFPRQEIYGENSSKGGFSLESLLNKVQLSFSSPGKTIAAVTNPPRFQERTSPISTKNNIHQRNNVGNKDNDNDLKEEDLSFMRHLISFPENVRMRLFLYLNETLHFAKAIGMKNQNPQKHKNSFLGSYSINKYLISLENKQQPQDQQKEKTKKRPLSHQSVRKVQQEESSLKTN